MIGTRLKLLRGEMNQPEFAKIAGTTKQYVSQLESGVNKSPNAVFIGRWAAHFGVSMEWITFGTEGHPRASGKSQTARLDPVTLTTALETINETVRRMGTPIEPLARGTAVADLYAQLSGTAVDPSDAVSLAITAIVNATKEKA